MRRLGPVLIVMVLGVLLSGGCPWIPAADSPSGASTSGGTGGQGGTSVSGGTQTGAGTDQLSRQFPGCDEPADAAAWRAEILRLVNEQRAAYGSPAVTWSAQLEQEAAEYACQLISDNYFGHVNPETGSTLAGRAAANDYQFWLVGENLAAGQQSPAEAFGGWMQSPCHRQNIINPAFTELGMAVRAGGQYGMYWVQEFGRPASAGPYSGPAYHDPQCTE